MAGIVISLIIIAVGAALRFAVASPSKTPDSTAAGTQGEADGSPSVNLPMIGLIVMAVGGALLVISIIAAIA